MSVTQSQGWQLTLTHPNTGRTVSPDVLDNPEFLPSINGLVEARIPVRRSQDLLEWPDNTTVSLTLDGTDQPLDEVVDFEQQSDRTIVVAEGGSELDNRVRTEYRQENRNVAAEEIITNNTTYTATVDAPEFDIETDVDLQSGDTTQEFEDLTDIPSTKPVFISNGKVETNPTAITFEAEDAAISGSEIINGNIYSDGSAARDINQLGTIISETITLDYEIPAGEWKMAVRDDNEDTEGGSNQYYIKVDGNIVNEPVTGDPSTTPISWQFFDTGNDFALSAGEHTIEVEVATTDSDQSIFDLITLADFRYYSESDFDNTDLSSVAYQHLDSPSVHPNNATVVFDDAITAFVITEATADIVIDDTSNEQSVSLSADRGASYTTETNLTTVALSGIETPQVRLRVGLSNYSPSGARSQTPRFGYESQSLDSFEVQGTVRSESLLIDQTFDDSVSSVLNQIAGDEYIWSYRLDNGTPTIAWTQPGQRTADSDPDIDASVSVSKSIKTWDAVTIKGSAQSASGEEFDGSTSFVDLVRDNIVPGSEAVRDPNEGTQFVRSEDYEMQYLSGGIRIIESGDMSTGTTYEIDYRYEVEGQFPEDYSGSGRELVETISGVVSDRQAQQLAYTILEIDPGVADPSWSADVLLPRGDELFDPLEALSLEQLELPDEATPLEVREPPQQTPQGIALQLGSRRGLDEALSSLSTQLKSVSRRS